MSIEDDFRAIVKRIRGWGFDVGEYSGCYGRSNGSGWANGKPVGHGNHHYVCSLNPDPNYIAGLVSNLANNEVVNWFADVNGKAWLLGTGPMDHFGTGNSSVLNRTKSDQPNYGLGPGAGDMSGNPYYSGTEGQHPGDSTPWPSSLLDVMFAINAAEFLQWGYKAERAIHHASWTNRKIDMSWLGGPPAGEQAGREPAAGAPGHTSRGGGGGGGGTTTRPTRHRQARPPGPGAYTVGGGGAGRDAGRGPGGEPGYRGGDTSVILDPRWSPQTANGKLDKILTKVNTL